MNFLDENKWYLFYVSWFHWLFVTNIIKIFPIHQIIFIERADKESRKIKQEITKSKNQDKLNSSCDSLDKKVDYYILKYKNQKKDNPPWLLDNDNFTFYISFCYFSILQNYTLLFFHKLFFTLKEWLLLWWINNDCSLSKFYFELVYLCKKVIIVYQNNILLLLHSENKEVLS